MKNPCLTCEKRGCGVYHDICENHIKFTEFKHAEKVALKEIKNFARNERKIIKGHKGWEHQNNISY